MRPLSLYWRRRRQMPIRIISRRMTSPTYVSSITNFVTRMVLHTHHHHREREREVRVIVPPAAPVVRWQRAIDRPVGRAPHVEEPRPHARPAPWLQPAVTVLASPTDRVVDVPRLRARAIRASSADATPTPRGSRPPLWQPRPLPRNTAAPRIEHVRPHPQPRAINRENGGFSPAATADVRYTTNASPIVPRVASHRESSPLMRRDRRETALGYAPMVWRAARAPIAPSRDGAIATAFSKADQSPQTASNATATANASSAAPPHTAARTSAAPVLALDGPALDRLAEDVMSRIDRRIRIERERRGL